MGLFKRHVSSIIDYYVSDNNGYYDYIIDPSYTIDGNTDNYYTLSYMCIYYHHSYIHHIYYDYNHHTEYQLYSAIYTIMLYHILYLYIAIIDHAT